MNWLGAAALAVAVAALLVALRRRPAREVTPVLARAEVRLHSGDPGVGGAAHIVSDPRTVWVAADAPFSEHRMVSTPPEYWHGEDAVVTHLSVSVAGRMVGASPLCNGPVEWPAHTRFTLGSLTMNPELIRIIHPDPQPYA